MFRTFTAANVQTVRPAPALPQPNAFRKFSEIFVPEGLNDNSPMLQRWVEAQKQQGPEGRLSRSTMRTSSLAPSDFGKWAIVTLWGDAQRGNLSLTVKLVPARRKKGLYRF